MFKELKSEEFNYNPFQLIGDDWMLITAGDRFACNTMTASYGSLGILFGKKAAQIFVRPERYTYDFLEKNDYFSLSFFDSSYRSQLRYCGRVSGRDENKIEACGFDLEYHKENVPYFAQSNLVLICKKIYAQDLNRSLLKDPSIVKSVYASGNDHRMYVGEIISILTK